MTGAVLPPRVPQLRPHRFESLADLNRTMADMPRYWALENDLLASFHLHPADPDWAIRQVWLSAVMFGALLNPEEWPGWHRALAITQRLPEPAALYFPGGKGRPQRRWFADPLTAALLQRYLAKPARKGASAHTDFANLATLGPLLSLDADAFEAQLQGWVLACARLKFTWQLPPVLLEFAVGELDALSLSNQWWTAGPSVTTPLARPDAQMRAAFRDIIEPILSRAHKTYQSTPTAINVRFSQLRAPIQTMVDSVKIGEGLTLVQQRLRVQGALAKIIDWRLNEASIDLANSVGTQITRWFHAGCPWAKQTRGRPKVVGAATMLRYIEVLAHSDLWAKIWKRPLEDVYEAELVNALHEAIAGQPEKDRNQAYWIAKRLYQYLGDKELPVPVGVDIGDRHETRNRVRALILTEAQYYQMLDLLDAHPGTPREQAACKLAAILMFRTGIRAREVLNLTTDAIDVIGELVELRVRATSFMKLKTATSKRTLPLNVLLSPPELDFLLRFRAEKVTAYRGQEAYPRLLFDTPLRNADFTTLLEPIETAIRLVCKIERPVGAESRPAYIYSRCSALRHSFASYAVASLLCPRDPGRFRLPNTLSPNLVSLDRRDQLEAALLAPGHLGLSAIQAVSQLLGHAGYRRTISTYTHLLDVILASHCARRSLEPALPAGTVTMLARQLGISNVPKADALVRTAFNWIKDEERTAQNAADTLVAGGSPQHHVPPRQRRRDGSGLRQWEVAGNSFWSQMLPPVPGSIPPPLPWILFSVGAVGARWRQIDAIMQMASREVPDFIIADELNMPVASVRSLMDRFYLLLTMRKAPRVGGPKGPTVIEGQLRNTIVFDETKPTTRAPERHDDGSWNAPLRPVPISLNAQVDAMWSSLSAMLKRKKDRSHIDLMRYAAKHDSGKYRLRNKDRAHRIATLFNSLYASTSSPIAEAVIRKTYSGSDSIFNTPKYTVHLERISQTGDQWSAAALTVYLLMLACLERFIDVTPLLVASMKGRTKYPNPYRMTAEEVQEILDTYIGVEEGMSDEELEELVADLRRLWGT